jgi:hypothetical protein
LDAGAAVRLQHALRVGAIRFVPAHLGPNVLHGEQPHGHTPGLTTAAPLMRRAARFHYHRCAPIERVHEALELPTRQRRRSTIRPARLASATSKTPDPRPPSSHPCWPPPGACGATNRFTAIMPRRNREESIPSLHQTAAVGS